MYHFFISDKNNHLRRNHINNEAQKLGITPNFYDAIMARELSKEELATLTIPDTFLTPGEIGCAASHLEVLKLFLKSDQEYVFIFEDDIIFSDDFTPEIINEIIAFITTQESPSILVLFNSIYKKSKIKNLSNRKISIFSAHNLFFAYGYILNRKAAENILKTQTPIKFEIDAYKFYYWLGAADLYCLNSNLVEPEPETSELSEINYGAPRQYTKQRVIKKNQAFRLLYNQLSWRDKLKVNIKRIQKALHKPFEKL